MSGGFLSFADPIANAVGFDRVKADRLVFTGGKLSGEVGDPIVDAMAKRDALIEAREQLDLAPEDVLAVGDGANDRLMVEEAGLGIAYRAKPTLVEVADAELKHHGLDALLWVACAGATGSRADYLAATGKQAWALERAARGLGGSAAFERPHLQPGDCSRRDIESCRPASAPFPDNLRNKASADPRCEKAPAARATRPSRPFRAMDSSRAPASACSRTPSARAWAALRRV